MLIALWILFTLTVVALLAAIVVAITDFRGLRGLAVLTAALLTLILLWAWLSGRMPFAAVDPTVETTAPTAAPAATLAPVAGSCLRDGQTVADNPNAARTDMSYFGGTSEPCYFYGEVNFGLSKDNRGLTVLMVIPPHWTLNANGFLGYAFWARESQGAVDWSIQDSTANLTRADGRNEATPIVIHVENEAEMAQLTELVRSVYPAFAYKLIPPALP